MKQTTGHLTEKKGKWYAVINLYTPEGKRKEKWHSLDLRSAPGTKNEAKKRFGEVLAKYSVGDLYLTQTLSRAEQERRHLSEMRTDEYIGKWLDQYKNQIAITTYNAYRTLYQTHIKSYFGELGMSLKEITGDEINSFYAELFDAGLKGSTVQRYHSFLHLAFRNAVKRRIIQSNPCDQADRPRATQYIASYLGAEGIRKLLDGLEDDPMRVPVILAAYYGLRRSEVLGIKWSAIDFDEKTISISHKIILDGTGGHKEIKGLDVMKTKSSYRTLPLIPQVETVLIEEKAKQEQMKEAFRSGYSKKYLEYVCVDAIGNLITPNYITTHFAHILNRLGLKKIRFHDLRHSCASLLLANGVPMKMIQDWLGHSSMQTTANIYSHVDSTSKLASAKVISNVLGADNHKKAAE